MPVPPARRSTRRRRILLLGVAVLLTASALLAVAILLIGRFGSVEGRILGTTALLGAFGILALPAAMLLDQERAHALAGALLALCLVAAGLAVTIVWWEDPGALLGKSTATACALAVAVAQTAALVARRGPFEPPLVRRLFLASTALVTTTVALVCWVIWTESGDGLTGRFLGALLVLDLLAAALQPILARARAAGVRVRMRITLAPPAGAAAEEVSADGRDVAAAIAAGIRRAERDGARVVTIEVLDRTAAPPG